ncbi:hypothetical protein FUAX_26750 [Fulvitalea axinellae]|uniref:Uncharacterized protein n=1 Tax=Fulvitalea axinellae TaxID=1182444 RepID=A0AAU9CJE8_9BACT|nr:hypothetical protein FUAX_26750 [Fulvitalea axinellae]
MVKLLLGITKSGHLPNFCEMIYRLQVGNVAGLLQNRFLYVLSDSFL